MPANPNVEPRRPSCTELGGLVAIQPPFRRLNGSQPMRACAQRTKHLSSQSKKGQCMQGQRLRGLRPLEREARHQPRIERDLVCLGNFGRLLRCNKTWKVTATGHVADPAGTFECRCPVSLRVLNRAAEAAMALARTDGSSFCIGLPWEWLELNSIKSERLAGD